MDLQSALINAFAAKRVMLGTNLSKQQLLSRVLVDDDSLQCGLGKVLIQLYSPDSVLFDMYDLDELPAHVIPDIVDSLPQIKKTTLALGSIIEAIDDILKDHGIKVIDEVVMLACIVKLRPRKCKRCFAAIANYIRDHKPLSKGTQEIIEKIKQIDSGGRLVNKFIRGMREPDEWSVEKVRDRCNKYLSCEVFPFDVEKRRAYVNNVTPRTLDTDCMSWVTAHEFKETEA